MRLRIRQLIAGKVPAKPGQHYTASQRARYNSIRSLSDRTYPRMSQLDLWSLAEICRVVGLSLSPESSLDPRRWERFLMPYDRGA
jgi:hypothetical protein